MKFLFLLLPLFLNALEIAPTTFDLRSLSVLVASKTNKNIIVTDDVKNLSVNYFIQDDLNSTVLFDTYVSSLKLKGLHVNDYGSYYIVSNVLKQKKQDIKIPQSYIITAKIFETNKNLFKEKGFDTVIGTKGIQKDNVDFFIGSITNGLTSFSTSKALGFATTLKALSTTEGVNIIQEPFISCIDGKTNSINVGGTIQVLSSVASDDTSYDSVIRNTYIEKPVGLTLTATPKKIKNKILVDLQLTIENVISVTGGLTTTTRKQTINSFVIEDGESILLGGILDKQITKNSSGIPLLMELPLLGYFFSYTEDTTNEKTLSILVTVKEVK